MALTSNRVSSTTTTRIFLAGGDQAITTIIFCNNSEANNTTLDVFAVANGGTVSTGTLILNNLNLPATETFVMDTEKLILGNGDALWARATVDEIVVATVSSVGI
jgi:hypothetical protein